MSAAPFALLWEELDMQPASSVHPETVQRKPQLSPQAYAFMNKIRFVAMRCRSKPKTDLFKTCARLQASRSTSWEAHADALTRCLAEALGTRPRFYRPGAQELSFDEAWLIQLGQSLERGDFANVEFATKSRVLPEHRRLLNYLVSRTWNGMPAAEWRRQSH